MVSKAEGCFPAASIKPDLLEQTLETLSAETTLARKSDLEKTPHRIYESTNIDVFQYHTPLPRQEVAQFFLTHNLSTQAYKMSRKPSQAARAPSHATQKLSPLDVGHSHTRLQKPTNPNQHSRFNVTDTTQGHTADQGSHSNPSGGAAAEEEQTGEDSDSAEGDADEEDKEAEVCDPNVEAPSDSTTKRFGGQTGHNQTAIQSQSMSKEEELEYSVSSFPDTTQKTACESHPQASIDDFSSDDEAYNDVDQISDSEKDGSDMDCFEEQVIIESTHSLGECPTSPIISGQPAEVAEASSSESSVDTWEGFDFGDSHFNHDQDFFDQDQDFFREQFERTEMGGFAESDSLDTSHLLDGSFGLEDDVDLPMFPPQRRVRFADPILHEDHVAHKQDSGISNGLGIQAPSALKPSVDINQSEEDAKEQDGAIDGDSIDDSGSSSGYESESVHVLSDTIATNSSTC